MKPGMFRTAEAAVFCGKRTETARRWMVTRAERASGKWAATPSAANVGKLAALLDVEPGVLLRASQRLRSLEVVPCPTSATAHRRAGVPVVSVPRSSGWP